MLLRTDGNNMKFKVPVLILLLIDRFFFICRCMYPFCFIQPQIFYGMNFDYFSIPLKLLIESNMGMNIFYLPFFIRELIL